MKVLMKTSLLSAAGLGLLISSCFSPHASAQTQTTDLPNTLLGWRAQRGLAQMCEDSWRWQRLNPQGFDAA